MIEHELEELLCSFHLFRQLALLGHVFEQRDQELRFAVLIARHHAPGAENALVRTALDDNLHAGIAGRRGDRVVVGLDDRLGRLRREDFIGTIADDLLAREAAELLERTVGEDVLAVVDVLHRNADRNVVDHRLEEALGAWQARATARDAR